MAAIEIDISDYLDELTDEELRDELRRRGEPSPGSDWDLVGEAYRELLRGDTAEAAVLLERVLFPKWHSLTECLGDLHNHRRLAGA